MPLFRVSGIPIGVDWGAIVMLGLIVLVLAGDYGSILGDGKQAEAFLFAVGSAFAFFGSIILHELGHAAVARRNGIGILGIDLWLLGGLAKMDREPRSPGVEFRVAGAGPAATALIAVICIGSAFALDGDLARRLVRFGPQTMRGDDAWIVALASIGTVNLYLLAFNLIPAYPLDGGRMARAIAWRVTGDRDRSTYLAAQIGRIFGYGLIAFGIYQLGADPIWGGVLVYMGLVLSQSARSATIQNDLLGEATQMTVADVMDRQPVVMPGDASVQRALDEFFWRYRWPWFPVVDGTGHFLGLIEQHSVELVDEHDRSARLAADLVAPESETRRAVPEDTPLTAVMANPNLRDYGALMAVDDHGVLNGVVTVEQVQRALQDAIRRATASRTPPPSDL
ncbi:MAG: site-2 protease family protein [Solirubrobacterales bacterium]